MVALPTLPLRSASAMRKALTMVSVWPLGVPVRGRLETMRIVPVRLAPATGLAAGEGAATADGEAAGFATGLAAGEAAGLAAAAGDAAAAAGGLVAAGAVVAGAEVGWAPPPPQAATNTVVANVSEDRRASIAPRID